MSDLCLNFQAFICKPGINKHYLDFVGLDISQIVTNPHDSDDSFFVIPASQCECFLDFLVTL